MEEGLLETVVDILKKERINYAAQRAGCCFLLNISEGNRLFQKVICEKGGLDVFLEIIKDEYEDLTKICCGAIWVVLSSPENFSNYCTPAVLSDIEELHKEREEIERINHLVLCVKREEDPRVRDAVSRGVCTKEAFPECGNDCGCDEGFYCYDCCVPQKAFRCFTCDKDRNRFYCEVCWKRDHQGHEGEEFFCPVRCATSFSSADPQEETITDYEE